MPGDWVFENGNQSPATRCCVCDRPITARIPMTVRVYRVTHHGQYWGQRLEGYIHKDCNLDTGEL